MRKGWRVLPLVKAVGPNGRVIGGPFGSDLTQGDYVPHGIPVIRVSNQIGPHIDGEFVFVSEDKARKLRKSVAEPGDIIVVQRGSTYGKVSRIRSTSRYKQYIICQSQMAVITDPNAADPEYIFHFLQSPFFQRYVESSVTQTGQPHINLAILKEAAIALPPRGEQAKIGEILQTWDEAIDQLKTLASAKVQLLSGLSTRLINNAQYSQEHLRDHLSELSERNRDENVQRILSVTNSAGFVLAEEMFAHRVASASLSNYKVVRQGQYAYNPSRINVGSIARLDDWPNGVLSPMYVVFKAKETLAADYFRHWLASAEARQRIRLAAQGSVRETVSFSDLGSITLPVPPLNRQVEIAEALNCASRELELINNEIVLLKQQKRGLMQKLLTGEWQVKPEAA